MARGKHVPVAAPTPDNLGPATAVGHEATNVLDGVAEHEAHLMGEVCTAGVITPQATDERAGERVIGIYGKARFSEKRTVFLAG